VDDLPAEPFYGKGVYEHPPTLTRTERSRFIRSYYSIWGLMKLDPKEWESRLQAMTSQELYYLREVSKWTQGVENEEIVPPPMSSDEPSDLAHSINSDLSNKRKALERRIWNQLQRNARRFLERDAQDPSRYVSHEGFLRFVVMWDQWQSFLKEMIRHHSRISGPLAAAVIERHLWKDGSDE